MSRRSLVLWLAASNETSNQTKDLVGARETEVAMIVTSSMNQVGGSKVSSGPTMGLRRKQFGWQVQ